MRIKVHNTGRFRTFDHNNGGNWGVYIRLLIRQIESRVVEVWILRDTFSRWDYKRVHDEITWLMIMEYDNTHRSELSDIPIL